jgi:hypothetical protein
VTLFTIQLELGPETRKMVERVATKVATKAVVQLEVGPKTREALKSLAPEGDGDGDGEGVQGLLRKGARAVGGG